MLEKKKEGAAEERKRPTEKCPMFFVICVPNQGETGEEGVRVGWGGVRREKERAQMDHTD